jgi:hypothetical protein
MSHREEVTDWATDFDIVDPDYIRDPSPVWHELRERCPVAQTERWGGALMPVCHEDVATIAHYTEHFSSESVSVSGNKPGMGGILVLPTPLPITADEVATHRRGGPRHSSAIPRAPRRGRAGIIAVDLPRTGPTPQGPHPDPDRYPPHECHAMAAGRRSQSVTAAPTGLPRSAPLPEPVPQPVWRHSGGIGHAHHTHRPRPVQRQQLPRASLRAFVLGSSELVAWRATVAAIQAWEGGGVLAERGEGPLTAVAGSLFAFIVRPR